MAKLGLPTLALREFTIDEAGSSGEFLKIQGRASGLIAWILTLVKLDPVTDLSLRGDRLVIKSASLSGETHTVIPVSAIESMQCGFSKALWPLAVATAAFLYGVSQFSTSAFVLGAVVALIFVVFYFFSKTMFISVSAGSRTEIIRFQRGVVEGVEVNQDRTRAALNLIIARVIRDS